MAPVSAVWVGNPFFHSALQERGWRVHFLDPSPGTVAGWDDIVAAAGFVPKIVVAADKSTPPFLAGMEAFPCLTAFYAVDTHIHSWFPHYAQGFDICLVSLRDHIPMFLGGRLGAEDVWWSPPYAHPKFAPHPFDAAAEAWDVLFVGTADRAVNPERCNFLDALAGLLPGLHVTRGHPDLLFPQAKIVLNHAIRGDLNFRVFEALGSGACLVTPFVRHGFAELFTHGEDLFAYDQNDVPALARLCETLLEANARRNAAAASGHAKVAAGHYLRHRAETFAAKAESLLFSGRGKALVAARLANAPFVHARWLKRLYLHHAETAANEALAAAYLAAATRRPPYHL